VFTNGFGLPVRRQAVGTEFRRLCKAAGITRPDGSAFQLRECRHSFVSMLSAAGTDIEVISDLVGHVNSGVTRSVYAHQITGRLQAAAQVMDQIFQPGAAP
jgi:site-specific recombinase XerD